MKSNNMVKKFFFKFLLNFPLTKSSNGCPTLSSLCCGYYSIDDALSVRWSGIPQIPWKYSTALPWTAVALSRFYPPRSLLLPRNRPPSRPAPGSWRQPSNSTLRAGEVTVPAPRPPRAPGRGPERVAFPRLRVRGAAGQRLGGLLGARQGARVPGSAAVAAPRPGRPGLGMLGTSSLWRSWLFNGQLLWSSQKWQHLRTEVLLLGCLHDPGAGREGGRLRGRSSDRGG